MALIMSSGGQATSARILAGVLAVAAAATLSACTAEPRPQLLIIVDTDAATVGQVRDDETLSPDAAIDTVRIELVSGGESYADETFVPTEAADWPLSFGVRSTPELAGEVIRVRLRAFRASLAGIEMVGVERQLSPPPEVTIERLVELELPAAGVVVKRIRLSLACMGRPPSFLSPARTCVDETRPDALASEGIADEGETAPTAAGTSNLARERPCIADAEEDRVCVPGGLVLLGDTELVGIGDFFFADAVPLRPAHMRPFWLDRTEVTVETVRQLAAQLTTPEPFEHDPGHPERGLCTWLGRDVATNDALPANCVTWETAREICQLRGGDLSTEAQWEHAASGRGQSRRYPWGDAPADCCSASLDRLLSCKDLSDFVERVASHPRPDCGGPGDIARDGALDMGGSVSEWMRDGFREYDDPDGCWAYVGIGDEPHCDEAGSVHSLRGASFSSGLGAPLAARRARGSGPSASLGFRCSYADTPD